MATPELFYKKQDTIGVENEDEMAIVDIDDDDGIDSDMIPSTVITDSKEPKSKRVPSNPKRQNQGRPKGDDDADS